MFGQCNICKKDRFGGQIWICDLCKDKIIEWVSVKDKDAPHGIPVWLWSSEWINEDFNPEGIKEGFLVEGEGYISCGWDPCQDVFTTEENSKPIKWAAKVKP